MKKDESAMQFNEDINYEAQVNRQYQQAVANGFKGTKEEYLRIRDHT